MGKRRVLLLATLCAVIAATAIAEAQEGPKEAQCSAPEYSQFDFWLGEWKVEDEAGNHQGRNRIEKILGGCALQESWSGATGMRGHSLNIYAKRRGVWHQTWVDSNGMLLQLDGGLEDGRMVMRGETPARDGDGTVEHEISWKPLPDGRVRQVWRISNDGGSTWNDAFVGIYTRATE